MILSVRLHGQARVLLAHVTFHLFVEVTLQDVQTQRGLLPWKEEQNEFSVTSYKMTVYVILSYSPPPLIGSYAHMLSSIALCILSNGYYPSAAWRVSLCGTKHKGNMMPLKSLVMTCCYAVIIFLFTCRIISWEQGPHISITQVTSEWVYQIWYCMACSSLHMNYMQIFWIQHIALHIEGFLPTLLLIYWNQRKLL